MFKTKPTKIAQLSLAIAWSLSAISCFDTSVFEKSNRCQATSIYAVNPLNTSTSIQGDIYRGEGTDADPDIATISMPQGTDLSNVTIQAIHIPSLASVEPDYRTIHDFTSTQTFWVIAENGVDRRRLDVEMNIVEYSRQLKYGSLTNYWTKMGQFSDGNSYYSIGEEGQYSPWANTNVVAAILNKASCVPSDFPNPTGNVVLTTLYNKTAGMSVGSGVAAGNLFLGEFRSNSANFLPRENQRKNSDQGIPFVYKPTGLKFEYKYKPGTQVVRWVPGTGSQKWTSESVAGRDSMELWAVLQKRTYDSKNPANTKFERIGAAGYISCEEVTQWKGVRVNFFYGKTEIEGAKTVEPAAYRIAGINQAWSPLWVYQFFTNTQTGENSSPVYEGADKWSYTTQIVKESWGNAADTPTHLSLTFNSSANGWRYEGAGTDVNSGWAGSRLEVRNVELLYGE